MFPRLLVLLSPGIDLQCVRADGKAVGVLAWPIRLALLRCRGKVRFSVKVWLTACRSGPRLCRSSHAAMCAARAPPATTAQNSAMSNKLVSSKRRGSCPIALALDLSVALLACSSVIRTCSATACTFRVSAVEDELHAGIEHRVGGHAM